MSLENNVLIDGNGNAFDSIETEEYPNFFISLWKKMWPSREVKCKYELKERTRAEDSTLTSSSSELKISSSSNSSSSSTATSNPFLSIFYGLSTSLGKGDKERCESLSSCSSTDNTPRPSPNRHKIILNQNQTPDIDTLYNDAPKTQTSRKVYKAPEPAPPPPTPSPPPVVVVETRVKTRRESILSNNRRYSRTYNKNINENAGSPLHGNSNSNNRRHVAIDEENENVDFHPQPTNKNQNQNYCSRGGTPAHKKVTFQAVPTCEENANDAENPPADRETRENFYNVNEINMEQLYKSGRQSDITIQCRGSVFPAHSFVLKAQSGYFRRVLFMQSDSNKVTINDIKPEDMQALLKYMYTGRIDRMYCEANGCYNKRFEFLLQDYDVPLPENSPIRLIVTDYDYSSGSD